MFRKFGDGSAADHVRRTASTTVDERAAVVKQDWCWRAYHDYIEACSAAAAAAAAVATSAASLTSSDAAVPDRVPDIDVTASFYCTTYPEFTLADTSDPAIRFVLARSILLARSDRLATCAAEGGSGKRESVVRTLNSHNAMRLIAAFASRSNEGEEPSKGWYFSIEQAERDATLMLRHGLHTDRAIFLLNFSNGWFRFLPTISANSAEAHAYLDPDRKPVPEEGSELSGDDDPNMVKGSIFWSGQSRVSQQELGANEVAAYLSPMESLRPIAELSEAIAAAVAASSDPSRFHGTYGSDSARCLCEMESVLAAISERGGGEVFSLLETEVGGLADGRLFSLLKRPSAREDQLVLKWGGTFRLALTQTNDVLLRAGDAEGDTLVLFADGRFTIANPTKRQELQGQGTMLFKGGPHTSP